MAVDVSLQERVSTTFLLTNNNNGTSSFVFLHNGRIDIYWCQKKKLFYGLLVTSRNLGHTSRVCLSLSLASSIGHSIKNKTSPTISLSSLASSIGNLHKKSSPTVSHSLLSFRCNKRTTSYADAAVLISVQTGQNLHESISMFYKLHTHLQECFPTSHARHVLVRFGFRSKSFFSLHLWCLKTQEPNNNSWAYLQAVVSLQKLGPCLNIWH